MVDFTLSEEQQMLQELAREFATENIRPMAEHWDSESEFPMDAIAAAHELGLMNLHIPEAYGGSGMGYHEYVTLIETISMVDPSIGLSIAAHNSLCVNHIYSFGTEEQRQKWLPKLCEGSSIGAWGLTEHNTGSDAGGMSTKAVKEGNEWVINGAKNFITHAISGDIAVIIARTGRKGDSQAMTAFVIEKGTPGMSSGKKEDKLGPNLIFLLFLLFERI